jgi:hypothetical protein
MALMHFRLRSSLLLLPICALLACGSSGSSTNISAAPTLQTGGYILTISPNLAAATQLPGGISAGVGANSVNAVFIYTNVQSGACGQQVINLTGTLNPNSSVLTLTSSAFAGSTATFTLQLPLITNTSGATVGSGTAVMAGGSCALASTTLQAQYIPAFSATWTGTLGPSAASFGFVEGTTANADGQFPITITGSSACTSGTTLPTLTGLVTGTTIQASTNGISLFASPVDASLRTLNVSLSCGTNVYSGTLSH